MATRPLGVNNNSSSKMIFMETYCSLVALHSMVYSPRFKIFQHELESGGFTMIGMIFQSAKSRLQGNVPLPPPHPTKSVVVCFILLRIFPTGGAFLLRTLSIICTTRYNKGSPIFF